MKIRISRRVLGVSGLISGVAFVGLFHFHSVSAATPEFRQKKILKFALREEPPTLNSMKSTDTQSFFVLGHVMEGLTRLDKDNKPIPGVAERWKQEGNTITFYLRKNALWNDGVPVMAKDFVFAWRKTLDPATASEYASFLYTVKNGEAINTGKMPGTALGAQVVDDRTLRVTLERPCPYFVAQTTQTAFFPVREDFYNKMGDKFAADAENLIFNGPFLLTKWDHGSALRFEKNPTYWNKDAIKIDQIEIPYMTTDNNAQFNFFKDRKTDVVERLSRDDLPKAQQEKFKVYSFNDGSVWYLEPNKRPDRPTRNVHLRRALKLVFAPDGQYVNSVVGIPGTIPGRGLIPNYMKGKKDKFRKEYPVAAPKVNIVEAKKELAIALKELGLSAPPSLTFLTDDTPFAGRDAEFFQNLYKNTLGIDLKIDKQIFKQRLAKMTSGEFDIVAAGWGPDYMDPMTFADLFASWNENNRGKYKSARYDELIKTARAESNPAKRMDEMAAAEKILLDEAGIIVTYERIQTYLVQPWVKGVVRRITGSDPDFTYAEVQVAR